MPWSMSIRSLRNRSPFELAHVLEQRMGFQESPFDREVSVTLRLTVVWYRLGADGQQLRQFVPRQAGVGQERSSSFADHLEPLYQFGNPPRVAASAKRRLPLARKHHHTGLTASVARAGRELNEWLKPATLGVR